MPYKQSNNPISRKTSPLRDKGNHPHPHNKPGVISIESPETARTSVHPESEHNPPLEGQPYPNPDFYERQSDMEESGADQPDYESDDYKPGVSRKSSSPVNAKCPEGYKVNPDKNSNKPCIKERGAENPAHPKKSKALSRKSSSPLNKDDQWIQKATASIKERGTEGVCTGDKFGSASCPPGSKRYTLAKTFKKMAKNR